MVAVSFYSGQIHVFRTAGSTLEPLSTIPHAGVNALLLHRGRLYVWVGTELSVYDLSTPRSPRLTGHTWLPSAELASAYEDAIYTSTYDSFYIHDATEPNAPEVVRSWGGFTGDVGRHRLLDRSLALALPRLGAVELFRLDDPLFPRSSGRLEQLLDPSDIGYDGDRLGRAVIADGAGGITVARVR
jgi:hypothetical protein